MRTSELIEARRVYNTRLFELENAYTDEFIEIVTKKLKLDQSQANRLKRYLKDFYSDDIKNFKEVF